MTREQAIEVIRKEYACVDADCDIERSCGKCELHMPSKEPILKAYEMAIQALSQEPTFDDECQKDMDEAWEQTKGKECPYPNNCPHPYGTYKTCIECKKNANKPCDDAISREAVIKIIDKWYENKSDIEDLIILITYMSSVTQKLGKWDASCTCSICGQWRILESEKNGGKYKFCPNCGACMKDGRTLDEFIKEQTK